MSKIVELRPRNAPPTAAVVVNAARPLAIDPGQDLTQRLIPPLNNLIRTLERSHQRIGALIEGIPDPEAARRLGTDLAVLSTALRDAKAKVAALSLEEPGNET
ncbi:MAG: hypothetical protein AB7S70_00985 [Hyphomicrobium sp.]|uniref:hypothetical protein n=1 Tax=Hyphomicrobium sp. TaxID=82 RepID=UPI003D0C8FD6